MGADRVHARGRAGHRGRVEGRRPGRPGVLRHARLAVVRDQWPGGDDGCADRGGDRAAGGYADLLDWEVNEWECINR